MHTISTFSRLCLRRIRTVSSPLLFARIFYCIPLFLFVFGTGGCTSSDIWGIPETTFLARIRHNNIEFLRHIDYDSVRFEEIFRLGEGSAYYMSFFYEKLDMEWMAESMLRVQWKDGSGVWRREASYVLLRKLLQQEDYEAAEMLGKSVIETFPSDIALHRMYIESIYWQEKTAEVLREIEKHARIMALGEQEKPSRFEGKDTEMVLSALFSADPELKLFYAATQWETETEDRRGSMLSLFTDFPVSELHSRGYDYLSQRDDFESTFSAAEVSFIKGKNLLARRLYGDALEQWQPIIEDAVSIPLFTNTIIRELERLYSVLDRIDEGIDQLRRIEARAAAGDFSVDTFTLYLALGRLYSGKKDFKTASDIYERALPFSASTRERDIALWRHMDAVFKTSPVLCAERMEWYAVRWENSAYYSDILEELGSFLIREKQWEKLLRVYEAIADTADNAVGLLYRYAVLAAADHGYLSIPKEYRTRIAPDPTEFRSLADRELYYAFLFGHPITSLFHVGDEVGENEIESNDAEDYDSLTDAMSEKHELLTGYLQFGLYENAYETAYRVFDELSPSVLRRLSDALASEGMYYQSVIVMKRLLERDDYTGTQEEFRMIYPQPYLSQMKRLAGEHHLPFHLFYGLVREESYFNPVIVSRAGAVGLSQLMPSTAEHIAGLMRKEHYSMTNPKDNLEIGAYYLNKLLRQFEMNSLGLFAYNAGPTRVRRWLREFGDLPLPLFLEAIPFQETRHYGRKVLVSAVFYGYLYEDALPETTITLFFPEYSGPPGKIPIETTGTSDATGTPTENFDDS